MGNKLGNKKLLGPLSSFPSVTVVLEDSKAENGKDIFKYNCKSVEHDLFGLVNL